MALCIPSVSAVAGLHRDLAFSRQSPVQVGSMRRRSQVGGAGCEYNSLPVTIKRAFVFSENPDCSCA